MDGVLHRSVLVLNAGMIPIAVCTVRKAVLDIFRNIAVPISESEEVLRSPSTTVRVPRIISRTRYNKIPKREIMLSKFNIFQRDDSTCAYCQKRLRADQLTIDHIVPRSRWKSVMGERPAYAFNSWRNLVTACHRCNFTKGNRLLGEMGWKLGTKPTRPSWLPQLYIPRDRAEKMGWLEYCSYNVKLIESVIG